MFSFMTTIPTPKMISRLKTIKASFGNADRLPLLSPTKLLRLYVSFPSEVCHPPGKDEEDDGALGEGVEG